MRKIKRLLPFVLSLMLLSSCGAPESSSLGYRQISMNEAVKMMNDEYVLSKAGVIEFFASDKAFRIYDKSRWHENFIKKLDKG